MIKLNLKRHSIINRIILSLAAVLTLQALLFAAFILYGGTVEQLNQNALDILNERAINRKNDLQNEMIERWSNLMQSQEIIQAQVDLYLSKRGRTYRDLSPGDQQTADLLALLSKELIQLMRRNVVSGAFVLFQGDKEAEMQTGLYLRDLNPTSNPGNNSALLLERGPSALGQSLNIPMDTGWQPVFRTSENLAFYQAPLAAAQAYPGVQAQDLGYWSRPFMLNEDNRRSITYSQPLLSPQGEPYGVIGIEVTLDYLQAQLPFTELNQDRNSAYLLAITEDGGKSFQPVVYSGPIFKSLFGETTSFTVQPVSGPEGIARAQTNPERTSDTVYASIQYFNLYNTNTPFEQQRWALIAMSRDKDLFHFSNKVVSSLLLFSAILLVLGVGVACLVGYLVSKPILLLAKQVGKLDPAVPVTLPPIHVSEIDDLSAAIESLSKNVADNASRLSQIIAMTSIPIGAFDVNLAAQTAYVTKGFLELFQLTECTEQMSAAALLEHLESLKQYIEEESAADQTKVFKLKDKEGSFRWIRLTMVKTDQSILGVVVDVTAETMEKRRIEYERDYDLLTNLLNRRAFHHCLARLEDEPEQIKTAALIMLDLDNLKHINDTYGHDYGDEYIRLAAEVLRSYNAHSALVARMSGDEFYAFFYGYETEAALKQVICDMREKMDKTYLPLPEGRQLKLRASAGIAWYPKDSRSLPELIRFADFAMYEVKTAVKGGIKDFDVGSYQRDAFLLYSREELNRLIDEKLVDFVFQPIVSCQTGAAIGYEALMRPRSKALSQPMDVLRLARAQSKLYQIERLTWFTAAEAFDALPDIPQDCLVFINSIPSQVLSPADISQFEASFASLLTRYVLELTEHDELNRKNNCIKQKSTSRHHAKIALDDFGMGHNNDVILLELRPDFVKVDMNITRNIHQDRNRQELFRNLANFCRERGIHVIAEGVETEEEMKVVVSLGADFIQGFYLAKPALQPLPIPPERAQALRRAYAKRKEL